MSGTGVTVRSFLGAVMGSVFVRDMAAEENGHSAYAEDNGTDLCFRETSPIGNLPASYLKGHGETPA